jgi:hypothetical protein
MTCLSLPFRLRQSSHPAPGKQPKHTIELNINTHSRIAVTALNLFSLRLVNRVALPSVYAWSGQAIFGGSQCWILATVRRN